MRVWVDLTNSPHVLVLRPVIAALEADGAEVLVTARDFAQTLELCERFGIAHEPIGRHRGERLGSKAVGLLSRSAALTPWWVKRERPTISIVTPTSGPSRSSSSSSVRSSSS